MIYHTSALKSIARKRYFITEDLRKAKLAVNNILRYALFQVARVIWQCNSTFRNYYEKKHAEGKHHYVILGHIQKKVVRVIFSVLKNNTAFREQSA